MVQTNCSETCIENYKKTCVCESVNYAKVMLKQVFFRLSPIGCRTMEINNHNSKNIQKSLQNWWTIHVESMLETVMQKTWKTMPTWSQNGDQNPSKKHEKYIKKHHEKCCKNEAPKSHSLGGARRGQWARSAGRGKEFLWRLQVKVPSCIQHPAKNKQTPGKQLKNNLEHLAVT